MASRPTRRPRLPLPHPIVVVAACHGRSCCSAFSSAQPNAPGTDDPVRRIRITHPFHPLQGREFVLVDERRSRHGDRVWYEGADGSVRTVPKGWTSLAAPDPFEVISAGRSWFRFGDLAGLVALLDDLRRDSDPGGAGDV